jgi:hypothetical protein
VPPITFLAILGLFATPAAIAFGVAWWSAKRELEIRRELGYQPLARQGADTSRLEQAVDAMAIEVERITEGQRFMTKLLAERVAAERAPRERPALPGSEPRVITPH